MRFRPAFSLVLIAASAACLSAALPAQRVETLEALADVTGNLPDTARAQLLTAKYSSLFPDVANLDALPDAQLAERFAATNVLAFYWPDNATTLRLLNMQALLSRRGLVTPRDNKDVFGALIKSRLFAEARAFQSANADVGGEIIPDLVSDPGLEPSQPSAMAITDNGLLRKNIIADSDYQIIVVAHPLCHFSAHASRDIAGNAMISRIFNEHSVWISPPERKLRLDVFREWNKSHPLQPMLLAYRQQEWAGFDRWSTPTFYFFKHGKLITHFDGWPSDGNWSALTKALDSVGAIPGAIPLRPPTNNNVSAGASSRDKFN